MTVHLSVSFCRPAIAKREAHSALMAEAQKNIGEQQTYGLIEWTKENILQVIGPHVFDEVCRLENRDSEQDPEGSKDVCIISIAFNLLSIS